MKKYILGLLAIGLCACGFTACSDDTENPYSIESGIGIVSSSLTFDAKASQGSIHFTAPGSVTATTSRSWCTAQVSGDSVIVSVEQNVTFNGRSATVTLHCGADSTVLAVLQNGVISSVSVSTLSRSNDDAASVAYAYKGNIDMSVLSHPDWVNARMDADSIYVDYSENATGHIRKGYLVFGNDSFKDSIKIVQADFANDIAGNYNITYYKSEDAATTTTQRNKALSAKGLKISSTMTLPMTYDATNGTLVVSTGSYVGTNQNLGTSYYVYMIYGLPNGYWTGYNTGYDLAGELEYDDVNGTTVKFGGMVSGVNVVSFIFRRFTAKSLAQDYDAGTAYAYWYYPVLSRGDGSGSAKASSYIMK